MAMDTRRGDLATAVVRRTDPGMPPGGPQEGRAPVGGGRPCACSEPLGRRTTVNLF